VKNSTGGTGKPALFTWFGEACSLNRETLDDLSYEISKSQPRRISETIGCLQDLVDKTSSTRNAIVVTFVVAGTGIESEIKKDQLQHKALHFSKVQTFVQILPDSSGISDKRGFIY